MFGNFLSCKKKVLILCFIVLIYFDKNSWLFLATVGFTKQNPSFVVVLFSDVFLPLPKTNFF